jgi:hypothetical protein
LIEFPSVVDAVACAVAIQEGMVARNADVPEDKRIVFRIVGTNRGHFAPVIQPQIRTAMISTRIAAPTKNGRARRWSGVNCENLAIGR